MFTTHHVCSLSHHSSAPGLPYCWNRYHPVKLYRFERVKGSGKSLLQQILEVAHNKGNDLNEVPVGAILSLNGHFSVNILNIDIVIRNVIVASCIILLSQVKLLLDRAEDSSSSFQSRGVYRHLLPSNGSLPGNRKLLSHKELTLNYPPYPSSSRG